MTRVRSVDVATDHDLLTDVGPSDHHLPAYSYRVLCNALSISPGTYAYQVALDASGHSVAWGVIRGPNVLGLMGNEGLFFLARDSSGYGSSKGCLQYSPSYATTYVGVYNRLHGDSVLSGVGMFGTNIRLNDAYISGSDLVLLFENTSGSNQDLKVWGGFVAK